MTSSRLIRPLFVLFLAAVAWPTGARAGMILTVDVSQTAGPSGRTTYSYTVRNAATASASLASFGVEVSGAADLAGIAGPTGWDVDYAPGDLSIFWTSSAELFDLSPGTSAVFSFTSPLAAGSRPYAAIGFEPDGSFAFANGTTLAPTVGTNAVPEPGSAALTLSGLVAAALARRARRSSRSRKQEGSRLIP